MRVVAAGLVALLLTAADAAAKGPARDRIDLCGAAACVAAPSDLDTEAFSTFLVRGLVVTAPAAPQPYYELWIVYTGGSRRLAGFFVPAASLVYGGDWNALDGPALASLRTSAGRIAPWPTPWVVTATVAGKPVRSPASYVRLFGVGRLTSSWSGFGGWVGVSVLFERSNPWAMTSLRISRRRAFVWRDGWVYRVPNALASRARRGLSLSS